MSTYKKGDRVRIGSTDSMDCGCLDVGMVGTVAENDSATPWVRVDTGCDQRSGPDDSCHPLHVSHLEPATFQMGDTVRLSGTGGTYSTHDVAAQGLQLDKWCPNKTPDTRHDFRLVGCYEGDTWGIQDTITGQQYVSATSYMTRATDEPQVTNQGEPTMSDNTILSNAVKALRNQPSDDAILLRKAGLEHEDGTPTDQAQTALLEELWQGRRQAYASKLRIAIKAEQAAEAGETTESK